MKRFLESLLVILAAPLWLPLFAVVALAVRLKLGSPVFFTQERAGWREKPFKLWKFRTMRAGEGPDAERITPFGRCLRAASLDELPQLFQVLAGTMALVGPRPLPVRYLPRYTAEQRRRHDVRPGITGLAQVNGRNALAWPEKLAWDVTYVDTRSLALDARILVRTVAKVFAREGISAPGVETAEEFRGTEAFQDTKDNMTSEE